MKTKSWLRLYHEFADDPKIQMLAFEDQRHYVMVLCMKGRGVLESATPSAEYRERMIAKALGLDPLTAREVKFRLMEPGLIDDQWQPVKWAERQFESDSSTDRVQKHRAERRKRFGNVSSQHEQEPAGTLVDRTGNVTVTAQIRAEQSRNIPLSGNVSTTQSADGRAIPSGSPAAPAREPDPKAKGKKPGSPELAYDEVERRAYFGSMAFGNLVSEWKARNEIRDAMRVKDLPTNVRAIMVPIVNALVAQAVEWERPPQQKAVAVILAHIEHEIALELRQFDRSSAAA
jgi:hypothetical protein